jgi:hypothetical protein
MDFEPGRFVDVYDSIGKLTWKLLNSSEGILRLELANHLGHPPYEGVEPLLEREGIPLVVGSRFNQMVGAMIKQIMLARGYVLRRQGVNCRYSKYMTTSAHYGKE